MKTLCMLLCMMLALQACYCLPVSLKRNREGPPIVQHTVHRDPDAEAEYGRVEGAPQDINGAAIHYKFSKFVSDDTDGYLDSEAAIPVYGFNQVSHVVRNRRSAY